MRMREKLLAAVSALVIFGAVGVANAQAAETKNVPGDQALKSVDRNLAKDPDNRGLQNAQERIERNQDRREMTDKAHKAKKVKADNDHASAHEKPEHAAKPERAERPDRPQRAGRT